MDGKSVAKETEETLKLKVNKLKEERGFVPILATILVGEDPASATYVRMKGNACERVGMKSIKVELPETTTTEELLDKIADLNSNNEVSGILLQHPVPPQIDERKCFDAIDVKKDVDGVTCLGFGNMSMGEKAYGSCTPQGIMRLLEYYQLDIEGKHAVVVGRSPILGKPMAMMLLNKNATVTICHSRTKVGSCFFDYHEINSIVGKIDDAKIISMINNNIETVLNLLSNCSIETTPNVYSKYGSFTDLVSRKSNIYVTYLPDEDMNKVIDTAKKLKLV